MRSFFQEVRRGLGFLFLGSAFFLALALPTQAARCGCACNDSTLQAGTVAGTCAATTCTATCATACTAHAGVSAAECGEDPTPSPVSGSEAFCFCSCGESMTSAAAPGGSCSGGDGSCTASCTTACADQGGFVSASCDTGSTSVPTPGSCVQRALSRPGMSSSRRRQQEATVARIEGATGGQPRTTWTCQSLPNDQIDANRCVPLGCDGTPFCCLPDTGSAPVTTSESGGAGAGEAGTGDAAPPPGQACATYALAHGTSQGTIDAIATQTGTNPSVWSCQRVCAAEQRTNCVQHGCPGTAADVLCCPPSIGIPAGQTCGGRGASGSANGTSGSNGSGIGIARLILPDCATSHDPRHAGNCQIADVFDLGYAAVRFMFGLSGALLLLAFVVSGFKYLVNGYAGDVKSAKETMVNATLGIVIMLFAYIIVTFLYTALTGSDGSNPNVNRVSNTRSSTSDTGTSPSRTPTTPTTPTAPSRGATGPSGTCRCGPSGLTSLLVGAATADQIAQAESACTGARAGAVFDRSAFTCTGPASESECHEVETAVSARLPTGVSVSCSWTR